MGVGFAIGQRLFSETVRATLISVSEITSGMLNSEIGRLKEETRHIAESLRKTPFEDIQSMLDERIQFSDNQSFLALTLIDIDGSLQFSGNI